MNLPIAGCADLSRIMLLCCDVDGVLTDGGIYYGESGLSFMKFNIRDGMGLKKLKDVGVKICLISQSDSPIIASRAAKLGVDYCMMGVENKKDEVSKLINSLGISIRDVCHIADDINDLPLLEIAGVSVAVPSAVDEVKSIAKYITVRDGGKGAIRELCDAIVHWRLRA